MKLVVALVLASNLIAAGSFAQDLATTQKLAKLLKGKVLSCEPANHRKADEKGYRGDDGYFDVAVKKNAIVIENNGGDGYGFANGGVRSAVFADTTLYLSVGDDGEQTLNFDFYNIGGDSSLPTNCGNGFLVSQPDVNDYVGEKLECCLKK